MDQAEFIEALNILEKEKGIDKEIIFEAIETSLVFACKKHFGTSSNIKVVINRETGNVDVFAQKEVVEEVYDATIEMSLEEARDISAMYTLGDVIDCVITPKNFGRISAQTAKQVVVQKIREAERDILYNHYVKKEKEIVTGIIQRKDRKNVVIQLDKIDAILTPEEQIQNEAYDFNKRLKVYIVEVKQTTKGPSVIVSRTHPELIKRLFEQEVPEIYDGTVEIKNISREAGSRTKIAVYSKNPDVDPVGACVGPNGHRVNVIVDELNNEKIDIITWSEDPRKFIAKALSPSNVIALEVDVENQTAKIVVPDNQLSLAIGKEGQNARLAAKLTGFRIDIKSQTQANEIDFVDIDKFALANIDDEIKTADTSAVTTSDIVATNSTNYDEDINSHMENSLDRKISNIANDEDITDIEYESTDSDFSDYDDADNEDFYYDDLKDDDDYKDDDEDDISKDFDDIGGLL